MMITRAQNLQLHVLENPKKRLRALVGTKLYSSSQASMALINFHFVWFSVLGYFSQASMAFINLSLADTEYDCKFCFMKLNAMDLLANCELLTKLKIVYKANMSSQTTMKYCNHVI